MLDSAPPLSDAGPPAKAKPKFMPPVSKCAAYVGYPKTLPPKWVGQTARARYGANFSKVQGTIKAHGEVYLNRPTPGIPPPPPEALGDMELIALHAHRYLSSCDLRFAPHRFTSVLNGRPWQLLVITHDKAPSHEWYNHLARSMFPLRPVFVNGVTAGDDSASGMKTHYCVTQWWKWKGLPYMALEQHPDDQGFIVCEPDFVFDKEEAESMARAVKDTPGTRMTMESRLHELLAKVDAETVNGRKFIREADEWLQQAAKRPKANIPFPGHKVPRLGRGSIQQELRPNPLGVHTATGSPTGHWQEHLNKESVAPQARKRTAEQHSRAYITPEVSDLTDYFNIAAKLGRDDVMWAGWNAEQWTSGKQGIRKNSPSTGAHCLLLTAACARKLLPEMQKCKDMHMGSTIKLKWMQDWAHIIRGSYLLPPIGGFYTHASTTTLNRTLRSHLDDSWAQPGTRERVGHPNDKPRHICRVTRQGPACIESGPLKMPHKHEEAAWLTAAPPGTPSASLGVCNRHNGGENTDPIGFPDKPLLTTVFPGDPERCLGDCTEHMARTRRAHLSNYCMRIFALPGQVPDVPYDRPQRLGTGLGSYSPDDAIIGWCAPDLHYPGQADEMFQFVPKAGSSGASSSGGGFHIVDAADRNTPSAKPKAEAPKAKARPSIPPWRKEATPRRPWDRSRSPRR